MAARRRSRRAARRQTCMIAASVVLTVSPAAFAIDRFWLPASNTTAAWHTPGNWSEATVPGGEDVARFNAPGTFVATIGQTAGVDTLHVSAGVVNIRSSSGTARTFSLMSGSGDLFVDNGASLYFGGAGASINPILITLGDSMTVANGSLTIEDTNTILNGFGTSSTHAIGQNGQAATMVVRDNASVLLGGTLNVGVSANAATSGHLQLESGAAFDAQRVHLATAGGATATMSVTNAQATVRDALIIGNSGNAGLAQVNVGAGAAVNLQTTGHVVHASGRIVQTGGSFVGGAGIDLAGGRVDVTGGTFSFGSFATLSSGAIATIGGPNALKTDGGVIHVNGSATRLNATGLNVNGGAVTFSGGSGGSLGSLIIGAVGATAATVSVNVGSTLTVTGGNVALDAGSASIFGTLRQTGSGTFRVDGSPAALSEWLVDGGALETASDAGTIGAHGRMIIRNDGLWTAAGSITVDGGTLDAADGTVAIAAGRAFNVRNGGMATVATLGSSDAAVLVTGSGSRAMLGGRLSDGANLTVNSGGRVVVSPHHTLTLGDATALIGDGTAVASSVQVQGELRANGLASSISIANGGTLDLSTATSGSTDRPTLHVANSAVVAETGGRLLLGERSLIRLETGGTLLADGGPVTLNGEARLELSGGSTVRAGDTLTLSTAGTASLVADDSNVFGTTLKMFAGTLELNGGRSTFAHDGVAANVIGNASAATHASFASGHEGLMRAPLIIGHLDSAPVVNVIGGATLTVADDAITIGSSADSAPVVEIRDAGSVLEATVGDVTIGGHAVVSVRNAGTLHAGGGIELDRLATLRLDGGAIVADALRPASGSGSVGTVDWSRGTIRLRDSLTLAAGGPLATTTLDLASDKHLIVDSNLTLAPSASIRLSGGTLDVGGAFVRQGTFTWTAGTLRVGQSARIGPTDAIAASLNLSSEQFLRSQSRITVAAGGLLALSGGSATAPTVDVQAGGEVLLNSTLGKLSADGSAAIQNAGLIRGDGWLGSVANAGELRMENAKRVRVDGTLSNAARLTLDGGRLDVLGSMSISPTGTMTGRGTVAASTIANAGSIAFSAGVSDLSGDLNNQSGGRLTISGNANVSFWDDVTNAAGGSIRVSAGSVATFFGTYSGAGITGSGTVLFEADLSPGFSPAAVSFGGDVHLGPASRLRIELGGTTPGTTFDQIGVAGALTLDGLIDVVSINGFGVTPGDTFAILSAADGIAGDATVLSTDPTAPGLRWSSIRTATTLSITASATGGDADLDADVDFDDLLTLARHYGIADSLSWRQGDFDRDGRVTFDDLLTLASHYGTNAADVETAAFASDWSLARSIVPEPASGMLLLVALPCRRRSRRS